MTELSRRLVFLGTPPVAAEALRALADAGHDILLVVTRADARRRRSAAPEPSAVKVVAEELGLVVSHRPEDVIATGADLGIVVAYGRLIKPPVLAAVPMINVHFSLLPRWRGAAPVERAILAGDQTTGVCLMDVEETLDTGAVYRRLEVPIGSEETADELRERLGKLGAALLTEALAEGLGPPVPQEGEPTYAAKIEPSDRELIWDRPAEQLHRVVRIGRAWTTFRGKRLLVTSARVSDTIPSGAPGSLWGDVVATGSRGLRLISVQPEGRAEMKASEWVRGARLSVDDRLGA